MNYDAEILRKKKNLEELKMAIGACYEILEKPLTKECIIHLMEKKL